jgi:hypothetical protein
MIRIRFERFDDRKIWIPLSQKPVSPALAGVIGHCARVQRRWDLLTCITPIAEARLSIIELYRVWLRSGSNPTKNGPETQARHSRGRSSDHHVDRLGGGADVCEKSGVGRCAYTDFLLKYQLPPAERVV